MLATAIRITVPTYYIRVQVVLAFLTFSIRFHFGDDPPLLSSKFTHFPNMGMLEAQTFFISVQTTMASLSCIRQPVWLIKTLSTILSIRVLLLKHYR